MFQLTRERDELPSVRKIEPGVRLEGVSAVALCVYGRLDRMFIWVSWN
jgi:hypothetical protein